MEEKRNKVRKPGGGRKKLKPEYDAGKNLKEQMEAGDVMHLSQNVVETFIDRIEVFNDECVKIRFTFEDVLKSYEAE